MEAKYNPFNTVVIIGFTDTCEAVYIEAVNAVVINSVARFFAYCCFWDKTKEIHPSNNNTNKDILNTKNILLIDTNLLPFLL